MTGAKKNQKWIRWFGNVLSLVGIVFVGITLYNKSANLDFQNLNEGFIWLFVFAVMGWQFVNASIGIGWRFSLKVLNCKIKLDSSLAFTFRTQIAKYIPGNVFHLVGRAVLLKGEKKSSRISIVSLLLESLILVVEGLVVWITYRFLGGNIVLMILLPPLVAFFVAWIGFEVVYRFSLLKINICLKREGVVNLALSCLFYYLIFIVQTVLFILLLHGTGAEINIGFWDVFNILTISWIGGYLVVGSPGGMGVREGIFGLLVAGYSSGPVLLLTLVLLRFASVLGDAMSFLISLLLNPSYFKSGKPT